MSNNKPESQSSEEVDLGQLFKLIGNGFKNLFNFIGNIFYKLFLAFVWIVFFTKKHILKIIIAAIVGFGLGIAKQKLSTPTYKSMIIVKQNYNTGENLYNIINHYNDLIADEDSLALSESLKITPAEANMIVGLELESVLNENRKLKLFDEYTKELDSTFALTMEFEKYIENANEYDYRLQKIILTSYSNKSHEKSFAQIIKNIVSSKYFVNEQKKDLAQLDRREEAIKASLKQSDSLQKVYQTVLIKSVETNTSGSQTSVTIDNTEDKSITKEFELYKSDLELRRELVSIERAKEDNEFIIEIISNKQNRGTQPIGTDLLGVSMSYKIKYAMLLVFLVVGVLFTLEFLNFLERYKSKI